MYKQADSGTYLPVTDSEAEQAHPVDDDKIIYKETSPLIPWFYTSSDISALQVTSFNCCS